MQILNSFLLSTTCLFITNAFILPASNPRIVSLSPKRLSSYQIIFSSTNDDTNKQNEIDLDETTKKYGLEVGLLKAATAKDGEQKIKPKDLLAKYGFAYLATSITLAIISYAICFALVSSGIDVASLLEKIGINATGTASNAGTAAIAYAFHKAASPIRFPPTVALTPIVAGWLGKKPKEE